MPYSLPSRTSSLPGNAPDSPARDPDQPETPRKSASTDRIPIPDPYQNGHSDFTRNNQLAPRGGPELPQSQSMRAYMNQDEEEDELPALQLRRNPEEADDYQPVTEDDPGSFDLVGPQQNPGDGFSLDKRSQVLFSREHLQVIFSDPALLFRFTAFLSTHRPQSVPLLVYYLDALKAIRAIHYANAVCEGLDPLEGHDFSSQPARPLLNSSLEQKANNAFDALAREDLPAYITHLYIQIVSLSISKRITGSLAPHLQAASEGLAEVFCLTDPSREDNPIVFASEEFNRTTQYGMSYVLGRNCRFLQGPMTHPMSVKRIREATSAGRQHQEVFLNYRRDGVPFMNLLMTAPLCDSRGRIRYFIGAQVDVSGLVKECTELESLQRLLELQERGEEAPQIHKPSPEKNDELRELSEMLNQGELTTVRRYGGRMHRDAVQDDADSMSLNSNQPRLLIKEADVMSMPRGDRASGRLSGVYQHYLLVRPYPSLRILFASPSQRIPGVLQSPFLEKIGGSDRVRDELTAAMAEGRGVTAKVRWVSKTDPDGRSRWIHCTPLQGVNGQIGVWMVVIIDDEQESQIRRWRHAPPVATSRSQTPARDRTGRARSNTGDQAKQYGRRTPSVPVRNGMMNGVSGHHSREGSVLSSNRSNSPTSFRVG